jgi:hypothetical protein
MSFPARPSLHRQNTAGLRGGGRVNIVQSAKAYERWLREQLRGDIVEDDLREKHEKMAADVFQFLRATYWRWAETVGAFCPGFETAPHVLAVGDIHLENYGVWRDADGRLVWGVNDFDEAAEMPYVLDLVRLAASAIVAPGSDALGRRSICAAVAQGYQQGLQAPRAFVLDREHRGLRRRFAVPEKERAQFWKKIEKRRAKAKEKRKPPPRRYVEALGKALPEGATELEYWPRTAGTGSLGRPRWVAYAQWRGAPILREAKALVPSGWSFAKGEDEAIRASEIANGRYRAPDPWYAIPGDVVVRRLSANSRKLDVEDHGSELLTEKMLRAMGHELANIHLATRGRGALERDLRARLNGWFRTGVEAAVEFVSAEYEKWASQERRGTRERERRSEGRP